MDLRPHLQRIDPLLLDAPALDAMDRFRREGHVDFLPVVDTDGSHAGVVRESSIRCYLLSLFGHELLHRRRVHEFMVPWPSVPLDCTAELALSLFSSSATREGLVVEDGGRYVGVLATSSLLALYESHRRCIQEKLFQAQKMEAIGTLAGGIAHDFNNLLNPIQGYAELLQGQSEGRARAHAEAIFQAAERAKELVQQILTFSRPQVEAVGSLSLGGALREVARLIEVRLPVDITLSCSCEADPDWVAADATRLHQVVMNLCANAVHAMRGRPGALALKVEAWDGPVEGWCEREGHPLRDHLCLSVRDEGCGMDPALLPRIFEPFFTTKRVGEGTGLGLALAHGLARQAGGCLSVSSAPGAGSTFRLYLPRSHAPVPDVQDYGPGHPEAGATAIALVDDEEANLDLLAEFLGDQGWATARFTAPLDALEAISASPDRFRVLITDLTMPDLLGDGLARRAKALAPDLRVFLMTGHADAIGGGRSLPPSIDRLFPKPMRLRELDAALRECTG